MQDKEFDYSEEALMTRLVFYDIEENDFNIFVEDKNKEFEYEIIFNRMFGYTTTKYPYIFGVGGKSNVEKVFNMYHESYKGVPMIYLVDGDFDFILEKKMIESEHYIYLERYNIESYFFDKNTIIKFVSGKLKKINFEVEQLLKYEHWENVTYEKLYKLFLLYLICQDILPEEKNVSNSAFRYLNRDTGYYDDIKIEEYKDELSQKIENIEAYLSIYEQKFREKLQGDKKRLICGKYVLQGLQCYLDSINVKKVKIDDLRNFLVTNFDIKKLDYVKEKINSICNKNKSCS